MVVEKAVEMSGKVVSIEPIQTCREAQRQA